MGRNRQTSRIDWEGVRVGLGVGLLVGGTGALLTWGTLTAPPGPGRGSASRVTSVSYGLARALPESWTARLAVGFGVLMMLFGAWAFVMGCVALFRRR